MPESEDGPAPNEPAVAIGLPIGNLDICPSTAFLLPPALERFFSGARAVTMMSAAE